MSQVKGLEDETAGLVPQAGERLVLETAHVLPKNGRTIQKYFVAVDSHFFSNHTCLV